MRACIVHHPRVELKRVEKEQKFTIIATDEEVNAELESYAKQNNMTGQQFLTLLAQQGIGADTFRQQLRAQIKTAAKGGTKKAG